MSEEDIRNYKKYISGLDITKYIILDKDENYWYSAEYVNEMLKKQNKEIEELQDQLQQKENIIKEVREYIESKNNGICIQNGVEKGAYTFVLNFDEAREFIWHILEILDKVDKEI